MTARTGNLIVDKVEHIRNTDDRRDVKTLAGALVTMYKGCQSNWLGQKQKKEEEKEEKKDDGPVELATLSPTTNLNRGGGGGHRGDYRRGVDRMGGGRDMRDDRKRGPDRYDD